MKKWVVVGANSFSGKSFCDYAGGLGDDVVGFTRASGWDVNQNAHAMAEWIASYNPDYVVNFAALNMVPDSWEHWKDYYQTNIIGMGKFVRELIKRMPGIPYVQISTPEVYGTMHKHLDESAPYNPSTPYAVSRTAHDMDLMALHKSCGLNVCWTRSVNVYGPAQQPFRIIPKTVLKILRGEKLELHGGGYSTRSFIHIDDVSESIVAVASRGKSGSVYHTSTRQQVTIRDLVAQICAFMGVRFEDHVIDVGERIGKDKAYQLDCSRIGRELRWEARIDLVEGLRSTVQWFRDHADEYAGASLEYQHKP